MKALQLLRATAVVTLLAGVMYVTALAARAQQHFGTAPVPAQQQ